MQATIAPPEIAPTPPVPVWETASNRIPITVAMCHLLEEAGLLTGRYELINGEIISKMGQNAPHRLTIMLINVWLIHVFGALHVAIQSSIDIGNVADREINAPEPDIVVQTLPAPAFAVNLPRPTDIVLLVEVSDTTAHFDLHNKAALYARAGIAEYWVADIGKRRIVAHRNPTPNGYADISEYSEQASIATAAHPSVSARVADLLPPAQPQAA